MLTLFTRENFNSEHFTLLEKNLPRSSTLKFVALMSYVTSTIRLQGVPLVARPEYNYLRKTRRTRKINDSTEIKR